MYRFSFHLALALVLPPAMARVTSAQVIEAAQRAETGRYDELVAKLGHASFEIREQAAMRLQRIGAAARPALMRALQSEDLETRMGAHRVLVHIMQADFDAQLQAFIDGEDQADLRLPGWSPFSQLADDTTATRRLFAEMMRDEPELLEKLEDVSGQADAEALEKLFEQRVQLLASASRLNRSRPPTIPCIATLLLISQQPQVRSLRAESRLYTFLINPSVKHEITRGPHYTVVQNILAKWVTSGKSEHYALRIALSYQLRSSGEQLARRILTSETPNGTAVAYSAMLLARFGDSADLKLLLPHLANTRVFHSWHNGQLKKEPIRIQVRDAVLAMAVRLTDQKPADYGYKLLRPDEDTIYKVYTLGFLEDSEREAAFQKWNQWLQDHPDRLVR